MNEINQTLESTRLSGMAIGNAMRIPWIQCKKQMKWYEIIIPEIRMFFRRIQYSCYLKLKYSL